MRHSSQESGVWSTRRILGVLGNVIIWGIVAVNAFFLWPVNLGGNTALVIVSGPSMEPTYFEGDLVIARAVEPSVGDVVIYSPEGYGGAQIIHRIVGGDGVNGWEMQGDNNAYLDPFTPTNEEVVGVVVIHYPSVGRLTALLMNPMVWAAVLLFAIVLLIWFSGDDCDEDEVPVKEGADEGAAGNGDGAAEPAQAKELTAAGGP